MQAITDRSVQPGARLIFVPQRFVNNHAGDRSSILLLLGRIDPMSGCIDRQTMNGLLNRDVFEYPKMIMVIFLDHHDDAT